jgi:dihydroorotase
MSKMMALGMPLGDVILRSTWNPAQMIRRTELGHLSAGAVADIALWNVMQGDFGFADASGGGVRGRERLFCEMTLKDGRIVWNWNARGAEDYRKLPPDYGIRKGIDRIVRP